MNCEYVGVRHRWNANLNVLSPNVSYKLAQLPLSVPHIVAISIGPCIENYCYWFLDYRDEATLIDGLIARIGCVTPPIDPVVAQKFRLRSIKRIEEVFKGYAVSTFNSIAENVENLNLPRKRKDQYLDSVSGYIDIFSRLEQVLRKPSIESIVAFGKIEKYSEDKPERAILPHRDFIKVCFGIIVSVVSKIVYKVLRGIKGLTNIEKLDKLSSFNWLGLIYELDISRMEACYSELIFELEAFLLKTIYPVYTPIIDMFYEFFTNKQTIKTPNFKMFVRSRRMSGEMTTSLTHMLVNWLLIEFAAEESGSQLLDFLLEGDDNITSCDKPINFDCYAALGFKVKVLSRLDRLDTDFCHITTDYSNKSLLRHPGEVILSLFWSQSKRLGGRSKEVAKRLLLAKALSYVNEYINCPIVVPLCMKIIHLLDDYDPLFEWDGYHAFYKSLTYTICITDDIRGSFEIKYKLSVDYQHDVERWIYSYFDLECKLPDFFQIMLQVHPNVENFQKSWMNVVDAK